MSRVPVFLSFREKAAARENLIQGDDQGRFNPEKTISRAEIATLLDRILEGSSTAETAN